ncbi:MAG: hypothetical protein RSI06_09650 [Lachnospiraceae bacterium]
MLSITEKIHRLFVSICFTIAPAAAFLLCIPEIGNTSMEIVVFVIAYAMTGVGDYWVRKKQVVSNKYMVTVAVVWIAITMCFGCTNIAIYGIHRGSLLAISILLLACCVCYYIPLLIRLKRKK